MKDCAWRVLAAGLTIGSLFWIAGCNDSDEEAPQTGLEGTWRLTAVVVTLANNPAPLTVPADLIRAQSGISDVRVTFEAGALTASSQTPQGRQEWTGEYTAEADRITVRTPILQQVLGVNTVTADYILDGNRLTVIVPDDIAARIQVEGMPSLSSLRVEFVRL